MTASLSYPDVSLSLGDILAALLRPAVSDEDAMIYAGTSLALTVANVLEADFDEVWRIMTHLPDGYLRLLESPEGWAALSAVIAAGLGISSVPVNPAIH
ncbi:MAG: hypothetical protein IPH79_09195 [Sphingomonadales bacterium]|nr:hypothetical protein [Sphingomonadales bacterium]